MLCLYVHVCPLCDLVFLKTFQEDYHTIVSGYDPETGQYFPDRKYPANHILKRKANFTLTDEDLNKDLDDIVEMIIEKIISQAPLFKKEPDLDYNIRRILLDYYSNKEDESAKA